MPAEPSAGIGHLRRVLLVNTADRGGGAEGDACAMLDGFRERGVDTQLVVGARSSDRADVVELSELARRPETSRTSWSSSRAASARRLAGRHIGVEDFEHADSWRLLSLLEGPAPDIAVLLNLHGGYFDLRLLPVLSAQMPVVLRLCDSWLFTGHCASPLGCERWRRGCGRCPDLGIPPAIERDATRVNWYRKRRILADASVGVVTPSRWLLDRARSSVLAPAISAAASIPNGVDLETFAPGDRDSARHALHLPSEAKLLVFVANGGRANPYKDFRTLETAMRRIAHDAQGSPWSRLELLVVGHEGPLQVLAGDVRIRHLPRVDSMQQLVALYRAADLYVHSAPEESFCNAAAEALACGLPVIAACDGGIRELVEHGRSGLHVRPGDPAQLEAAILSLLADEPRRDQMGREARSYARARLDARRCQADLYSGCSDFVIRRSERGERPPVAFAEPD